MTSFCRKSKIQILKSSKLVNSRNLKLTQFKTAAISMCPKFQIPEINKLTEFYFPEISIQMLVNFGNFRFLKLVNA